MKSWPDTRRRRIELEINYFRNKMWARWNVVDGLDADMFIWSMEYQLKRSLIIFTHGLSSTKRWNEISFYSSTSWAELVLMNLKKRLMEKIIRTGKLRRSQISVFQPPKQFKDPRLRFHWVHDPMTFDLPAGFLHPTQDIKCDETYFTVLVKLVSASPLSQQTRQN